MPLNYCRNDYYGGRTQGGAHWMNYATCPTCGKTIKIMKNGLLYPHGTRRKAAEGGEAGTRT